MPNIDTPTHRDIEQKLAALTLDNGLPLLSKSQVRSRAKRLHRLLSLREASRADTSLEQLFMHSDPTAINALWNIDHAGNDDERRDVTSNWRAPYAVR